MLNRRLSPSDTPFMTKPAEYARTPIRGAIILESSDKRNALLEKTGAIKVGYSLKTDSTIGGIYLMFPPTDAQAQELEASLGEPSITATQGIGESFGVIGWNQPGCSIILSMYGPYDWPVKVPQQLVLRFTSTRDIKDTDL